MKESFVFLIIISVLFFSACGPEFTNPEVPLEVFAGDELQILLSADASTGYHWELMELLDPVILRLLTRDYKKSGGCTRFFSDSYGREIWTFKTSNPGETEIHFGYLAPDDVEFSEMDPSVVYRVIVR